MSTVASPPVDCPILVWMLSLNREYTLEEYEACFKVVARGVHHTKVKHKPEDPDNFRQLITLMLPLLMMRHRRIPRARWKDRNTQSGKHWIEQAPEDMTPERFMTSMIGYHLAIEGSLCAMAMCQGTQRRVVNIGMAAKQAIVHPHGASVSAYVESQQHKLTPLEFKSITAEANDETMLRRLCITLALKEAYTKAIGQPIGFDYSRLEFNIPARTTAADNIALGGWEFRIWQVTLGVARKEKLVTEQYHCACAFFRGTQDSRFIFFDSQEQLNKWVQFINIDQMMKVLPKLNS